MKREIRTIKGYINAMKRLADNTINFLKGFDELSAEDREEIILFGGEINNSYGELKHLSNNVKSKVKK